MDFSKVTDVAKSLSRRVGARILSEVRSERVAKVSHKGTSDIVTEIDLWSEQEIIKTVGEEFPTHLVIGEETSGQLALERGKKLHELVEENICWVVDPLDGTTNFSNKVPHCAVSIGIVDRGVRVAGVVFDPFRDELFEAIKGQGALLNGNKIQVSKKTELVQSLMAVGFPNDRWTHWEEHRTTTEALVMSCRNVRACGAAAIEISWVACGRFDGFFEFDIKPWDICAASFIVEEAGGRAKTFGSHDGNPFSLFGRSHLFSNPAIFSDLCEVIESKKARPPKQFQKD